MFTYTTKKQQQKKKHFVDLYEVVVTFSLSPLVISTYSFSAINNQHLQHLWDWTQHNLSIQAGRLFFSLNPKLCMSEIHMMWEKTGIAVKPVEGDFRNNGERASCEYIHVTFNRFI